LSARDRKINGTVLAGKNGMAVTCNQRVYHLADRDKGEGYAVVVFERTPRLPAKKTRLIPKISARSRSCARKYDRASLVSSCAGVRFHCFRRRFEMKLQSGMRFLSLLDNITRTFMAWIGN
jgi:hypothetical protein